MARNEFQIVVPLNVKKTVNLSIKIDMDDNERNAEIANAIRLSAKQYLAGMPLSSALSMANEIDRQSKSEYKKGDKVTYIASHTPPEKGIVKEMVDSEHCRVVYNCAEQWEQYENYTAALTHIRDLKLGWD